ncbi:hypothetical protein TIFTF001_021167 [Ficus carica]|uniref:Uncharacterized protein n=1 Tax=Ficus carica TaxID=3494 RepID=A0AA88AA01_FICCA|nr:hypothetical protein TIFTF001_021167 [Ficus carica]
MGSKPQHGSGMGRRNYVRKRSSWWTPPEDRLSYYRSGEPVASSFCLTNPSSFYKKAPSDRPVSGRLSVLEHVGRLGYSQKSCSKASLTSQVERPYQDSSRIDFMILHSQEHNSRPPKHDLSQT